jgi:hypothetical protein
MRGSPIACAFKLVVFAAVCLSEGVAASAALAGSTPTNLGNLRDVYDFRCGDGNVARQARE